MDNSIRSLLVRGLACFATALCLQPSIADIVFVLFVFFIIWLLLETSSKEKIKAWVIAVSAIICGSLVYFGLAAPISAVLFVVCIEKTLKTNAYEGERLAVWVACLSFTQIPPFSTGILHLADWGPSWFGLVASPIAFVIAGVAFGLLPWIPSFFACASTVAIAFFGAEQEWLPFYLATACTSVVAILPLIPSHDRKSRQLIAPAVLSVTVLAVLVWLLPASSLSEDGVIWLPDEKSSSSKYYQDYSSVLKVSGFTSLREIKRVKEVNPGELVIFPHAAHPDFGKQLGALKSLPHYRTLRIMVVGEHTDVDGVASVLTEHQTPIGLNTDTTIPPRNSDFLGWVGGLGATPSSKLALNRGASVTHGSLFSAPLLWVTGGHREADRSDDGRIGDYVFRFDERVGSYSVMSIAREVGGPTWIVLGDSTPVLNEFLIVDPESYAKLLALSSGIPAVLALLTWLLICFSCFRILEYRATALLGVAFFSAMLTPISLTLLSGKFRNSENSQITITDRDVFGDRAVGRALVSLANDIMNSKKHIEIGKVSSQVESRTISIGHPAGWERRLDCSRAGGISLGQLRILDVSTCPEARENSLLSVGDDSVVFSRNLQTVVLDQHFIANAAPIQNIEWIRNQLRDDAKSK